jgi:multicomponent Na+:H+ antiporter subunit B
MIRKIAALAAMVLLIIIFLPLIQTVPETSALGPVAREYAENGVSDTGAANLVTAVVVTYRGLDTLGEVTVLFLATAGVAFLLGKRKRDVSSLSSEPDPGSNHLHPGHPDPDSKHPDPDSKQNSGPGAEAEKEIPVKASELLATGSSFLFPLLILFGVYIFVHGHLTPGGGFQGGVVIASAVLLLFLADPERKIAHRALEWIEAGSGFFYAAIGIAGLFLAGGFLDNRILPLGIPGELLSAGAIPIIYSLVGLKVGSELANILDALRKEES